MPTEARDSAKILIVDDDAIERRILQQLTQDLGHTALLADNGRAALQMVESEKPDLLLLDIMMPEMNGDEVLEHLRGKPDFNHLHVIVISAIGEIDKVARCIEMGADDYLVKPFNRTLLEARIAASFEKKRWQDERENYRRQIEENNRTLEQRVQDQVREISDSQWATIFAMSRLAESRDPETGMHLERIREYSRVLAERLGQTPQYAPVVNKRFIENIYAASPLHDIGKVGIPDHILLKPGKLTDEEFGVMKLHASIGAETLLAVTQKHPGNAFIMLGIEIALCHHEKWDGSGYPEGRKGEEIPPAGRIVAVADVYDALRTKRHYKPAFSHEKAKAVILEGHEKHFDPDVVDAFLASEGEVSEIAQFMQDAAESVETGAAAA